METNEFFNLCQRILASVLSWREKQSDLIKAIHASTLPIIHDGDDPSLQLVLEKLDEEHSEIRQGYSEAEILSAAKGFLGSEFLELSAVFSGLYTEFNHSYFAGKLPTYRVRVMHCAPNPKLEYNLARFDDERHNIGLLWDGRPEEMISLLVDTMACIASELEAEPDWGFELDRLYAIGAPTRERVEELDGVVEWANERASCCLPEDQLECRWLTQGDAAWRDVPGRNSQTGA